MADKNKESEELEALRAEIKNTRHTVNHQAEMLSKHTEELDALRNENSELKDTIEEQEALIKEQAEELAKKDDEVQSAGKYPVFEVKGKSYDLVTPKSKAKYEGKQVEITAKSLKGDKKLLEFCVKQGFEILQERKKGGE